MPRGVMNRIPLRNDTRLFVAQMEEKLASATTMLSGVSTACKAAMTCAGWSGSPALLRKEAISASCAARPAAIRASSAARAVRRFPPSIVFMTSARASSVSRASPTSRMAS